MEIKSLLKITQVKSIITILLAPIFLGAVESFYKFDLINIPLFLYTALIVILAGIAVNSYHVLSLYKHKWFFELEMIKGIKTQIPLKLVRILAVSTLSIAILMVVILYQFTTLGVIFPFALALLIFFLYAVGPKPLWQTSLNELVYSFGVGYFVTVFITYSQVYFEVTNILSFYILILWVSLPVVLALACMQFVYNQKLAEYNDKMTTMATMMGFNTTFMVMEIATGLACLLPCIAIYLNDMPWTVIFIWLMYPKLVINLRKYLQTTQTDLQMYYVRQNVYIIIVFQLLLTIFGIFF